MGQCRASQEPRAPPALHGRVQGFVAAAYIAFDGGGTSQLRGPLCRFGGERVNGLCLVERFLLNIWTSPGGFLEEKLGNLISHFLVSSVLRHSQLLQRSRGAAVLAGAALRTERAPNALFRPICVGPQR